MKPQPPTPCTGTEATKRVNAFLKKKKTYLYAIKSEFKKDKKGFKNFLKFKPTTTDLLWNVLIWSIGVPLVVLLIILCIYWGIVDLL